MSGGSGNGNGNGNGRIRRFNMPSSKRPRVSTPTPSESEADSSPPGSDDESDRGQETVRVGSNSIVNGLRGDPERGAWRESERALLSVTLTDLTILDCPICSGSLVSPVYQCRNGHIACFSCCTKIANKCPNCRCPIGTLRCRALEKVLELVAVNCRNKLYGCTEKFSRNQNLDKLNHDKLCCYNPWVCPYDSCEYIGMLESLYKHFGEVHSPSTFSLDTMKSLSLDCNNSKRVYLQDISKSMLFILERTIKSPGSFVSVTCVGPDSMGKDFSYDLTAVIGRDKYVMIKAGVECVRVLTEIVLGKCLVLPRDMVSRSEKLEVELIIRRNPTSAS